MTEIKIGKLDTVPELDPYHMSTGGITKTVLKIYENGLVEATQECDNNSTPMDEWHGRTLTIRLAHCNEKELREYLDDNELLDRIIAGHTVDWDGSNMVGALDDDASEALEALHLELEEYFNEDYYAYWTAEDWLDQTDDLGITADTPDAGLQEIAGRIIDDADDNVILRRWDVVAYLEGKRAEMRQALDD